VPRVTQLESQRMAAADAQAAAAEEAEARRAAEGRAVEAASARVTAEAELERLRGETHRLTVRAQWGLGRAAWHGARRLSRDAGFSAFVRA
jgi:hypothetical protein